MYLGGDKRDYQPLKMFTHFAALKSALDSRTHLLGLGF